MRKRKAKRRIAVVDMETDPFVVGRVPEPFLVGFYDGESYIEFSQVPDFLDYLSGDGPPFLIYAHNGGKFDSHFIAPFLPPGTEFFIINGRIVSFKYLRHEFRDSYAILPIALEQYAKTKIDYSWFERGEREKHRAEISSYLKDDCINLYRLVTAFIAQYGDRPTMGLTALNHWRQSHQELKHGVNATRYFHRRIRPFFAGGRTQAFESGVFQRHVRAYDLNSAYASAMVHSEHPFGSDVVIASGPPPGGHIFPHCFYLIEAESDGCLPTRNGPTLLYPSGRHIFHATGHELVAGLETGTVLRVRFIERYIFRHTISFRDYIEPLFEMKRAAQPKSSEYIFAKLLMNSLHGKFAANPDNYWHYVSIPARQLKIFTEKGWKYDGLLTDDVALVCLPLEERERHYYNIAITASITGLVRATLWRTICKLRKLGSVVYYCDTDSIITDGKLPVSDELGGWKLEHEGNLLAIAGRKLYAMRGHDGKWKIAHKGAQLTPQQVIKIARGGTVEYRSAAPTFRLGHAPTFVKRTLRRT
jgi:hypothetical protein